MLFAIILQALLSISSNLVVKSSAFEHKRSMPVKYTCDGDNVSPPLSIEDIPQQAASLALIMDDPKAPQGPFTHWVLWNIPVDGHITENSVPGQQGKNSKRENRYCGPCPPKGKHLYHFKVYALDTRLELPETTDKEGLLKAMSGHIVATGLLIGEYRRRP